MRLITASRRRATSSSSDFTSSLFTGGVGMTTVDLGALQLENALYIARSRAIDAYSRIEQSITQEKIQNEAPLPLHAPPLSGGAHG